MGQIILYVADDELEQLREDLRFIGVWYLAQGKEVGHRYIGGQVSMTKVFNELVSEKLAEIEEAEGIKE